MLRVADDLDNIIVASARLRAPARRAYDTIADYHAGHPRILPQQFSDLTVEQGGVGAGTTIRFTIHLLGRSDTFRAVIAEPEPGRVLVERNIAGNDAVTTFTVDPAENASESTVTIRTEMTTRSGLAGKIERLVPLP